MKRFHARETAPLLLPVLFVGALGLCAIGLNFWTRVRVRPEARVQMQQAFTRIPLGAAPTQVRNLFTPPRYTLLKLRTDTPSLWSVTTPTEWGAENWTLYLEWSAGRLVAKRIRTNDGPTIRPREPAPRDVIHPNWKSPQSFWR